MKIFYFTFGFGQQFANCVQPIIATDAMTARLKMTSIYGNKWSFQYEEEDYLQAIESGVSREKIFPPILVQEDE